MAECTTKSIDVELKKAKTEHVQARREASYAGIRERKIKQEVERLEERKRQLLESEVYQKVERDARQRFDHGAWGILQEELREVLKKWNMHGYRVCWQEVQVGEDEYEYHMVIEEVHEFCNCDICKGVYSTDSDSD